MSTAGSKHSRLAGPALRLQPDARLVRLARDGSERALEEIVRRYRPALLRYAGSFVPRDRAEDVVQDALTRALPGVRRDTRELHLRPWLYRIVRNTALNEIRDSGPPHEQLDESYDGVEQPPQAMDRREQVRALVAGARELPAPQREALVKRELEGLTHSEIGVALGVSAGAARQLIFRARTALRDGLGLLIPMPLLRQLVERGTAVEAGAAGGGALALKATAAMLATGAAVTAGVAIKGSDRHHQPLADSRGAARRSTRSAPGTAAPTPAERARSRLGGSSEGARTPGAQPSGSQSVVLTGDELRAGRTGADRSSGTGGRDGVGDGPHRGDGTSSGPSSHSGSGHEGSDDVVSGSSQPDGGGSSGGGSSGTGSSGDGTSGDGISGGSTSSDDGSGGSGSSGSTDSGSGETIDLSSGSGGSDGSGSGQTTDGASATQLEPETSGSDGGPGPN